MSNGKREKILMIVILVLVLINTATLVLMWVNKPPFPPKHPHHQRADKIIIERLQLDEQQQKEFEVIKNEHRSQMRELDEELNGVHQRYFALLESEPVNDSLANVYEQQLAGIAERREEKTFIHFKKLKAICKPGQIQLFNDLVGELGKILSGPKGPPPPRR